MCGVDKAFRKIVENEVEEFEAATKAFGSKIMDTLATMVMRAFEAEYVFISEGILRKPPKDDEELRRITEPTFGILRKIQEFREGNRHVVEYSNHMATIAESVAALSWVTVPRTPVQFVKDMKEAGDYFGNRVLTTHKGNDLHVTWINKWNAVLTALEGYVKTYHLTGFSWNVVGAYSDLPVPFFDDIPAPPPPPPMPSFYATGDASNAPVEGDRELDLDRQALLRDLRRGVEIINILKPVNPNAAPRAQSVAAPRAQPAAVAQAQRGAHSIPARPPVFVLEGKKWRVEYQKNVQAMEINPNDKSESLAMYKCENSSLETKAKMNAVTIDNCKKCVVILQHIISSVELIRCERLEIRCMGTCQNVTLDNCDSVQIFLTDSSANCEVITAKCTSTNVCRLADSGDYVEFPVPEQIKSVFVNGKLQTSVVEHRM